VKWQIKKFTVLDVLLVGKYQEQAVLHLAIVDDTMKFLLGLLDARAVRRVNNEDQTLGACSWSMPLSAFCYKTPDLHLVWPAVGAGG
jgi:hypothetical protein